MISALGRYLYREALGFRNQTFLKHWSKMGSKRPCRSILNGSWVLLGCFFGVGNRAFIKHWSKMGSKRPLGSILEPPGLDFGAPGPRFWSLRASIFKPPGLVLLSLPCSCFLLLSLAFFCFLFLALAFCCFLLLSLGFSSFLLLSLPYSCCAFRSIAAQVFARKIESRK